MGTVSYTHLDVYKRQDNTYEWCAQGVIPEIDRLQNVDMDVIKWWYDTFSKGESIIITDIEAVSYTHLGVHQMEEEECRVLYCHIN